MRTLVRLVHQIDVVTAGTVVQVPVEAYPPSPLVVVVKVPYLFFTIMAYHNHIGDVICPDLLRWQQESRYDAKEDSSHTLLYVSSLI